MILQKKYFIDNFNLRMFCNINTFTLEMHLEWFYHKNVLEIFLFTIEMILIFFFNYEITLEIILIQKYEEYDFFSL